MQKKGTIALMDIDLLLEILDRELVEAQGRPLNSAEVLLLKGLWKSQTYVQIAQASGYSPGYIANVVALKLYRRLSALIGERVTKKNCRRLLQSYSTEQDISMSPPVTPVVSDTTSAGQTTAIPPSQSQLPSYPNGSIPPDSPFYIERCPIETQIYQEIDKPGALIRIKAPEEMGKTSLLLRTLDHVHRQGYQTISLNLEQIDQAILSNLNRFLRWLCAHASHQLRLEPKLDDYWNEDFGSKVSCTLYFRSYLLSKVQAPLVLALDEVNQLFEHPQVAKDALPLLRSWYEEAKRLNTWKKLRLIIVHSTEIYVPLQLKQSPFNVGLPIQLNGFSLIQVQQLAKRYGLAWDRDDRAQQLMAMIGGHPALVHQALYHLSRGAIALPDLLKTAATNTGIYGHHLQRHWATLQGQPRLATALKTVLEATEPVELEPILAHKLSSMGLIKQSGDKAVPGCELYRRYFIAH